MSKFKKIGRVCFDLLVLIVVWFAFYVAHEWFQPIDRGFSCNDESLKYPFRKNTVSVWLLTVIVLAVPNLIILITELSKHADKDALSNTVHIIRRRLKQCCIQIVYYMFGLGLLLTATEITKRSVGRLRPHFMDVCQPQMADGTTCADVINYERIIENFICQAKDLSAERLSDMKQSFPSGHSSSIFFAMTYTAIYLQAKLGTGASTLLKHLLQFICVMFAGYVSLTRISDNWHHWTDVLAGSLLGIFFALFGGVFITKLFSNNYCFKLGKMLQVRPTISTVTICEGISHVTTPTTASPSYIYGSLPYLHNLNQDYVP